MKSKFPYPKDCPVSRRVWREACERVEQVCGQLGLPRFVEPIVNTLRFYVMTGVVLYQHIEDQRAAMAFYMLKPEIDRAKERSARARESAKLRKLTPPRKSNPPQDDYPPQPVSEAEMTEEDKDIYRQCQAYFRWLGLPPDP